MKEFELEVEPTVVPSGTSHFAAFPTELKGLGADFTFGFIQVMDGEKDPRNLLVAFQIVRDIIVKGYVLGKSVLAWLVM